MRVRTLAAVSAIVVLAAGCTDSPPSPPPSVAATTPAPAAAAPADTSCRPRQSLRPSGPLPQPGNMPAGSWMATVQKRGRLLVGTSQDTLLFSSRNPFTGKVEGFDVDVAREIARAIFGHPDKIQIVVTTNANRIPYVQNEKVDLVAKTMTINCERWKDVNFSSVYYEAGQKVLVSKESTVTGIKDLAGKKVCAAAGSTSLRTLQGLTPKVVPVAVAKQSDCLVAFQRNKVDAISIDDTLLAGLAAQDPYAKIVGDRITEEPYGLALSKEHPEFTRFVNAVLAKSRADGTWQRIYRTWLGKNVPAPPAAEYQDREPPR
jgi:polar amino acid transport system substrate-binding protein